MHFLVPIIWGLFPTFCCTANGCKRRVISLLDFLSCFISLNEPNFFGHRASWCLNRITMISLYIHRAFQCIVTDLQTPVTVIFFESLSQLKFPWTRSGNFLHLLEKCSPLQNAKVFLFFLDSVPVAKFFALLWGAPWFPDRGDLDSCWESIRAITPSTFSLCWMCVSKSLLNRDKVQALL